MLIKILYFLRGKK